MRQNGGDTDQSASNRSMMGTFGLQLKILRGLGVELGYAPFGTNPQQQTRFDNPWYGSALIYIVPTSPVGAYLKAGVGNTGIGSLFNVGNATATYHAGGGIEVYVSNHIVLGGEFLMLVPGASQIVTGMVNTDSSGAHSTGYYVAPSNFRASFRASYYF